MQVIIKYTNVIIKYGHTLCTIGMLKQKEALKAEKPLTGLSVILKKGTINDERDKLLLQCIRRRNIPGKIKKTSSAFIVLSIS